MVEEKRSPRYGIPLTEVSDQMFDEVLAIYYRVAMGREDVTMLAEDPQGQAQRKYFRQRTLEDLTSRGFSEWRFGSRLSGQSKLHVKLGWGAAERLVYFECYDNLDLHIPEESKRQGRQMETDFNKVVDGYLLSKGVAKQVIRL